MTRTAWKFQIRDRARYGNALIGLAAGDAWGYQVEFTRYDRMPRYPVAPPPAIWRVSDDTQMTLAVHHALTSVTDLNDVDAVTAALTESFLAWQIDPDNNRAPGNTCMTSLSNLRAGARWFDDAGALESAGCGAVMRLTPAAFAPEPFWRGLTALQAVITHRHPRAVVPALLLADAIRNADRRPGNFLTEAMSAAAAVYDGTSEWLDDAYLAHVLTPITGDMSSYLVDGLNDGTVEMLVRAGAVLDRLLVSDPADFGDPCSAIGEGWESASAVALGLLVADLGTADDSTAPALTGPQALAWAATSNGDSDSIACIAGALIGAAHSVPGYWPANGLNPHFETRYSRELRNAAAWQRL